MFTDKTLLITGGTGSFGNTFEPMALKKYKPRKVIVFSRDKMKQWKMAKHFADGDSCRFFICVVRDRLYQAIDDVCYVIHAATKIVTQINRCDRDHNRIKYGVKAADGFVYSSCRDQDWMTDTELQYWNELNKHKIGTI